MTEVKDERGPWMRFHAQIDLTVEGPSEEFVTAAIGKALDALWAEGSGCAVVGDPDIYLEDEEDDDEGP
jgi:hypothetical protein